MTNMDFLLEAVGIVAAMIYLGLQIYYGIVYGVAFTGIILNAAILILVYVGLTLLARYPERVNNLPKEICSGKIRKYTIHMVRAVKLIFVLSLLFTSICDAAGVQINKGYSLVTVALIVIVTVVYVLMGILVSVLVGIALTLPISSAAICAALNLTGLAGGAAVAGCCAQMVGFAVMSFKENGVGGLVSQGIGTSMLQMPNILKKPRVWLPPIIASAITGPIATCVFKLQMNGPAVSSGMGTCGLVGQIGVYTGWVADVASGAKAGITAFDWAGLLLVSFVLPAVLCAVLGALFRKKGWIKDGDLKLD